MYVCMYKNIDINMTMKLNTDKHVGIHIYIHTCIHTYISFVGVKDHSFMTALGLHKV